MGYEPVSLSDSLGFLSLQSQNGPANSADEAKKGKLQKIKNSDAPAPSWNEIMS